VARAAGFVTLSVSNPGPGIPVERLPWVFDRFHRLDRAGDNLHDGVGLGLAIVKSVMQLHGGHVTVESVPGGDTTFTLHFPHQSQEN
jgi:signal transduction histidine kinase